MSKSKTFDNHNLNLGLEFWDLISALDQLEIRTYN